MGKKLIYKIKLHLKGCKSQPSSILGSLLGPYGINIINFCKEFNSKTSLVKNLKIPIIIYIYSDKTYFLKIKTPTIYSLLLKEFSLESKNYLKKVQIFKIIFIKSIDFPLLNFYIIYKNIINIAYFLNIKYEL
uniref:50S ribosomal protein L11 n=1 Tax=Nephromyces sp. ex Molgula occidentalis TaxID=2544991 RepID=A0A5C1H800_9APIC|nr:50S ribosomal protein L11 [Nephromyces sp. ex Molgula occidentalis]